MTYDKEGNCYEHSHYFSSLIAEGYFLFDKTRRRILSPFHVTASSTVITTIQIYREWGSLV